MDVFRGPADRDAYLHLMRQQSERFGLQFLAWCLMSNHVHLLVVPKREDSLAKGIGEAHRLYTRGVNFSEGVRGYLFQGRFGSCVLDERHLLAAARYVELNPVRARMVKSPEEYEWSSARFHLDGRRKDPLVTDRTLMGMVEDWRELLSEKDEEAEAFLRKGTGTGRPAGDVRFVKRVERRTGRELRRRKPGPKPKRQRTRS
jgi:putative transposase